MNLLYVIASYGSNSLGNLIHQELGHEFQKHGHTFSVFAVTSANERAGRPADSIEENIPVHRAIASGRLGQDFVNRVTRPVFHYERFASATWDLARYLARHPFDLVLAEGAFPCGAMTALCRPRRLMITMAGGDFIASPEANYGYGRFRTSRALMRLGLSRAKAVRITSPLIKPYALALGAPADQIVLIPRNIASYCYAPTGQPLPAFRAAARRKLDARYAVADTHVVAAVGRLLPIKGFDVLIRALPGLLSEVGNTRVLIIGPNRVDPRDGDYQQYLERLAAGLGVRENLIFTGAIPHPEIRDLLAGADAIAVPSVLEGMNKIVVEGAAVGTPSIVTATAGIAELMRDAGIGEIIAERSPEALADALAALLNDPARRAAACVQGPPFAARFSSAQIGAELVSLCERIADDLVTL